VRFEKDVRLAGDVQVGPGVHEKRDDETVETCRSEYSLAHEIPSNSLCCSPEYFIQDRKTKQHTQHLCENENQNHADEQPGLLRGTPDAGVADDADRESGGQTGETDGEAGAELDEARVQGRLLLQVVGDEDADDQAVDADDTGHDDGDDV